MIVTDNYVFFCKGVLGNWARTPLKYKELDFFSSEQLFMFMKAELFNDLQTAFRIFMCIASKDAKALGREVKHFNQERWDEEKYNIMYSTLSIKALQCEEFKNILLENHGKTFVECNPEDRIWAIGLAEDDDRILDPKNWQGENLLGAVLTNLSDSLWKMNN